MRVQKFHFQAYIEMYDDDMSNVRKMIAEVQNRMNLTYYETVAQVFIWGIESGAKRLEDVDLRRDLERLILNRQMAEAFEKEIGYNKRIWSAVRELGEAKAMEIAGREGMDMKEVAAVIEKAKPRNTKQPLKIRMELWLSDYMKGKNYVRVTQLKKDAKEAGLLSDDPNMFKKDWNMMRRIGASVGYSSTGRQGTWADPATREVKKSEGGE